jgi:hypothetical protein
MDLLHLVSGYEKIIAFVFGGTFSLAIGWKSMRQYNSDLKDERDDYRRNLHLEREQHQATKLYLAEMESRPNLTTLEQLLKAHNDALKAHMDDDHNSFILIQKSLRTLLDGRTDTENAFKATAVALEALTVRIEKGTR